MSRSPRPSYRVYLLFSALIVAALTAVALFPYSHSGVRASLTSAPGVQAAGEAYGKLPLSFVENVGQADSGVKFLARGAGYGLFLTADEAVLALQKPSAKGVERAAVRMKLLRSNGARSAEGREQLAGSNNYFIGDDPAKWRTGVPAYARVQFGGVYPGVDLVYYGNQRQLEYDFVVAPGSDPRAIALGFEGVDQLEVDAAGELVLHTAGGEVRQRKPVAYQETDGARQEVAADYVLKGGREVAFQLGDYDTSRPLVIDPVLVYSTYLGGINSDSGYGIAVNASGQAFITGTTASDNFPVSATGEQLKRAAYPGRANALYTDAFVTKLNGAGTAAVYSTYIGGGIGGETGKGIAVDSLGNAYVTGVTGGGSVTAKGTNDFPLVNAAQTTFGGTDDIFVVKLNPTGSDLIFSTYLGGNGTDTGERIAVNAATGESYITGGASAGTFPTTPGAYKPAPGCVSSNCFNEPTFAYVAKFTASGAVDWATLVGPGTAYDIAIDAAGNSYLTGGATNNPLAGGVYTSLFPVTPGAHQTANGGNDSFVTKLNPQGSALVYSTFLGGGPGSDRAFGIAVDPAGNAYVTGQTQNAAFPVTPGAFDVTYNGGSDAFVAKFNADGSDVLYATFLGGTAEDIGRAIALDKALNVYVTGQTKSLNFPVKNSIQPKTSGAEVFLTKLNTAGSALVYSTYLGTGDGRDVIYSETYGAFLTGQATQIPVTGGAFQTREDTGSEASVHDAFVMRVRSTNETTPVYSIGGKIVDTTYFGSASPGLVTVTLSGSQSRTTYLTATGTYSFGALPAGTYTVTASKPGFKLTPASQTFTSLAANQVADFTVLPNDAPTVAITSPAQSSSFTAPASITVTAAAADTDGAVAEVQFYANTLQGTTVIIGTDTTAPYSVTWTNVAGGEYVLGAIAKDDLGAVTDSEGIAISVASTVPATVALTSPTNGAVYKTGDSVNVNASVSGDGAAVIDYVDFYAGTTLIGRDTTSPYGIVWRPTTAGDFSLTAKAVDLGKAVGTSPARTITVNDTVSTLQGLISEGTAPLSGVTVTLSGAKTGTVTTGADGKYSFANLPAEGGYTVTPSKAGYTFNPESFSTDFLGYYDRAEHFTAVKSSAVSVMVTSPSWGARYTAPATVTIEAAASSTAGTITKVEFYAEVEKVGKTLVGTDTTAPYSFVWRNAPAGSHGVFAVATDSTGGTKTSESNFILIDPAPATVALHGQVTDGGGTGMSGIKVTLSGSKNATAVTNLYGYYAFGGLTIGGNYTVTPPASYTWTPAGRTYTNLTADEIDVDFNTTSFNSAPTVTVTSPSAGKSVASPATIALSATASDKDGTITRVQFYRRTATSSFTLGTDTVAPYSLNWGISTPGTYEIVAVATDNGGLRTTSAPITITVTSGTTAAASSLDESFTDPALWLVSKVEKADASQRLALVPYFDLALKSAGSNL